MHTLFIYFNMIIQFYSNVIEFLKFIIRVLITLPRDLQGLFIMIYIELKLKRWEKSGQTAGSIFNKLAQKQPNKPCLLYDDLVFTFKDVEEYSNRIAHLFSDKFQLKKGDVVALFMENRPQFPCIWLGLSKIGCITALINTNLRSQALVHSINISNAKILIYGDELADSVDEIRSQCDNKKLQFIVEGSKNSIKTNSFLKLEKLLENMTSTMYIAKEKVITSDVLLYIYTSGTTGLPKPAIIKHSRFLAAGISFFDAAGLKKRDIVYITLPIYHAHGGLIGIGAAFVSGATVVLRKKFSASNFWKECIHYKCTAIVYVGELLRYLVNQPPSELDRKHNVRRAIGNGLRANVWLEFVKRFNVKPLEFFAASEGNCTIVNVQGKVGACGFLPILNRFINALPLTLIKIDDNMNPIRDKNGFCIACEPGEKGLAIGFIGTSAKSAYSGYANNKQASEKKIVYNVFKKGQKAFNSGDLMVSDDYGWIYFCDRLGDTYRWKGENVSTVEVENIISSKLNSTEVICYGVEIPGQEGKAGMAAIVIINNNTIDMKKFSHDIRNELTAFARPVFIRLCKDVEHTGTFKAKKNVLVEEAYNINKISDKMYYYDVKEQSYLPLTSAIYNDIINSKFKI